MLIKFRYILKQWIAGGGAKPDWDGRYFAFISYRSSGADQREAAWLQTAIETYRLPPVLAARLKRPPRLGKLFRDAEELPATPNLRERLMSALKQSDNLIVLCSPRAAASLWIDREIEEFAHLHGASRIFAVLMDGEPDAAFPSSLLRLTRVATHDVNQAIARADEPLAADLRPVEGLSQSQVRRTALLRLVAGLLDIGFDDLRNRDAQRRNRRLLITAAAAMVSLTVVSLLGIWSEINRREAVAQRARAVHNQAEALARVGDDHLARRQMLDAEFSYASSLAVQDQLQVRERLLQVRSWGIRRIWEAPSTIGGGIIQSNPDGSRIVAAHIDQVIRVFDANSGRQLASLPGLTTQITAIAVSPDGKRVAGGDYAGRILVFDIATGSVIEIDDAGEATVVALSFDEDGALWSLSADGRLVNRVGGVRQTKSVSATRVGTAILDPRIGRAIIGDVAGFVRILDMHRGTETAAFQGDRMPIAALALDISGQRLATWASNVDVRGGDIPPMRVRLWRVADFTQIDELPDLGAPGSLHFSPEEAILIIATNNGVATWDIDARRLTTSPSRQVKAVAFSRAAVGIFAIGESLSRLDRQSLRPIRWLAGHSRSIEAVAFSPDGREVATAGLDDTVRIWDAQLGVEQDVIAAVGGMSGIHYGADGRTLIGCAFGGSVMLWDRLNPEAKPKRIVSSRFNTPQCASVGASHGRLAAIVNADIRFYAAHGEPLPVPLIEGAKALALTYSPDGSQLAVVDENGEVSVYNDGYAGLGDPLRLAPRINRRPSVAWAPNGRMLAVASDKLLLVWKLDEPQKPTHQVALPNEVHDITFSADGQRIVAAGRGDLLVVDAITGMTQVRFNPYQVFQQHLGAVRVSTDGRRVAIGADGGILQLLSLEDGPEARALRPPDRMPGDYSFTPAVAFSPIRPIVAVTGYDKSIRVWNLETGLADITLRGDYARQHALSFAPDGQHLLTGSEEGAVRTIDLQTQAVTAARVVEGQPVHQLTASPDGTRFAFATRETGNDIREISNVVLWNRSTGKIEAKLLGHRREVLALAFHPHQSLLASASYDSTARLWDLNRPGQFTELTGHGGSVTSVAFSRDGLFLATTARDGYVRVFDGRTGSPVTTLRAGGQYIEAVAFSPTEDLLVASGDGGSYFWETRHWARQPKLIGHEDGWVQTAAIDPTGRWLLTTSQDAWMRLWDLNAVRELKLAPPSAILSDTIARTGRRPLTMTDPRP